MFPVFRKGKILFLLILMVSICAQAQTDILKIKQAHDTATVLGGKRFFPIKPRKQVNDSLYLKQFKPDPMKVVWMAAIIPGYGQIMNRKYWKLPIVYGGFLGCAYAISWNSVTYQTYTTAYRDIIDTDPTTNSYLQIIPKGRTIDNYGGIAGLTTTLKTKQDVFRRYRDLSIIAAVGFYALTIIDAYVDAELYDFDISPDLSMHIQPTLLKDNYGVPKTLGMQCSIKF